MPSENVHGITLAATDFGHLHRHGPNARLNVTLRMMAAEDNPRMPLIC